MPIILAVKKSKQEGGEFKASLDYIMSLLASLNCENLSHKHYNDIRRTGGGRKGDIYRKKNSE